MSTFYKVVKSKNRGLISARSVSLDEYIRPEHIIHYRTQRWVKPKIPNSKIFVFQTLKDAKIFADDNEHIYECEVRNPQKCISMAAFLNDIYRFWTSTIKEIDYFIPKGTYLCDAVKLIRRIC